jgi:hypothetical protein
MRWPLRAGVLAATLAAAPAAPADRPLPRPGAVASGPVCGDAAILGETLPAIEDGGGCGIARPVRLRSVAGVALAPEPTLGCDAAGALKAWVRDEAKPAFAPIGARLEGLEIADDYSCRNRNRAARGKLSEHARGGAIDIAGFRLADGTVVSVADGWTSPRYGTALRRLHAAACGPFGTALGPGSDEFHETHLHYDVEERRIGPYCR